ncbi:MAG: tetratricopeptide repeat protein [Proteobacteria bacterium]|nr:tetratricopeptide repeat protein [Pseudomonadota bacterium]
MADLDWESRVAALWQRMTDMAPDAFVERLRVLASERPASDPVALFELGSAQDSTGHPDRAVPLYRAALAAGLDGYRRRRATIQLASSLRNLGQVAEAVRLLEAAAAEPRDEWSDATSAFLALALSSAGRDREALSIALHAVSHHLPRYNASLRRYADALVDPSER